MWTTYWIAAKIIVGLQNKLKIELEVFVMWANKQLSKSKDNAVVKLMAELSKGEQSAKEKGWIGISDVEKMLDNESLNK